MEVDDDNSDSEPAPFRVKQVRFKTGTRDPLPQSLEKGFRLVSPVQKDGLVDTVVQKILDAASGATVGQVAAIAPEVVRRLRWSITKTRQPKIPAEAREDVLYGETLPFHEPDNSVQPEYDAINYNELPSVDCVYISTNEDVGLVPGSIVVPDAYMQYLDTLKEDEAPKQVYVARDSASLRVVFPLVAGTAKVEAVTDSGSQIVSMGLTTARRLSISWDPDVQIFMQSANGQLRRSAGLARNVSFVFGDITVYLQVHIIDQPAYEVLLGRPFEILTESMITNSIDGSQTLTIRDPNSKRRATLPTHARGTITMATQPKVSPQRATMEEVPDEDEPKEKQQGSDKENVKEVGFRRSSMN